MSDQRDETVEKAEAPSPASGGSATAKRQELQEAIHREHEAWGNVNYWRLEESKWGKRVKALTLELAKCESPNTRLDQTQPGKSQT